MTDRLDVAQDSSVGLYASSMTFNSAESSSFYLYYDYNTPAQIKVEYSPHGTGDNDTYQVQTIRPAFNIAQLAGVNTVEDDSIDAQAEYFNLQGIRIAKPEAGQTVICRRGSRSEKLIVR